MECMLVLLLGEIGRLLQVHNAPRLGQPVYSVGDPAPATSGGAISSGKSEKYPFVVILLPGMAIIAAKEVSKAMCDLT